MQILTEYRDKENKSTMQAVSTYGKTIRDFKPGEAVGIYLRELYPTTIDLIESLLYFKHPLTLKYGDKQYKLNTLDDWKYTYQDPKDQIKTKTWRHDILEEYLNNRREYTETKKAKSLKEQYKLIFENFELPSEEEIDQMLQELAPLYEVDVDYTDNLSRYRSYVQIKYYLEHDFEYSKPANAAFIMPIGNETYLEDLIYKEGTKDEEVYV